MADQGRTINVGAAQLPATRLGEARRALERITSAMDEAAGRNVELLVLPESAYPAYFLPSVETFRSARVIGHRELLSLLGERAKRHRMHVVCGFVEDHGDRLQNAAALIDDAGAVVGVARKLFLWGSDNQVFAPGSELGTFACRLGRVGIAICADVRAPETTAALAYRGAEIVTVPVCWVNLAEKPGEYYNPQPDFLIEARTREIAVPFVCANKFGVETETLSYCGQSLITDAEANVLSLAPPDEAALITAEVQPARACKPALPDWTRDRITSTQLAEEPHVGLDDPVKVAALPAALLARATGRRDILRTLAADGVQVVVSPLGPQDIADEMEVYARALGLDWVGSPSDRVMCARFGSYGALSGSDLLSFAPARALALDGAAILFVPGPPLTSDADGPRAHNAPLSILRTRAAENRVYLAAAGASATVIDPSGAIVARSDNGEPRPVIATIDLAAAQDKCVFPGTHIFEQRKPEAYAAAFR
ncbi:MAG: hypothetical protein JSV19_04995 [Phycisphaerales bacterium]|nr:MAG: hypothetical protein JSV19_04995 [Phycisphaerales bacterium]